MRKRIASIILGVSLLLCSCGTETISDSPEPITATTDSSVTQSTEETPDTKNEETNTEKEEEKSPLSELIDQYGSCITTDNTPIVGQLYNFNYKDTIKSVEDIASYSSGTYTILHFEDSRKDTLIIDGSRPGESSYNEVQELLDSACAKYNISTEDGISFSNTSPKAGDTDTYRKSCIISDIRETGVEDDEKAYYVITSDTGLESLIGVFKYKINDWIPMVGEVMFFYVEDTVSSVTTKPIPGYGIYATVEFENSIHNTVVVEGSSLFQTDIEGTLEPEHIAIMLAQFNQYGETCVDNIPQPGEQVKLEKSCQVTSVTLEKENEKGTQFYIVEGTGGIQAKLMVRQSQIPANNDWEYGTLTDSSYDSPKFGLKINLADAELNSSYHCAYPNLYYDLTDNECLNSRVTFFSGYNKTYNNGFNIELRASFFKDNLTEETALEVMEKHYKDSTGISLIEDQVIGGKTYHTVSYTTYSGSEMRGWYRIEDNVLYHIVTNGWLNSSDMVLAMMGE